MLTRAQEYYSLAVGIIGIIAALVRMIYQLGRVAEAFRMHVKESKETHVSLHERLTYLERRRR